MAPIRTYAGFATCSRCCIWCKILNVLAWVVTIAAVVAVGALLIVAAAQEMSR